MDWKRRILRTEKGQGLTSYGLVLILLVFALICFLAFWFTGRSFWQTVVTLIGVIGVLLALVGLSGLVQHIRRRLQK
jgi:uncharacterized membrane protein